MVGEGVAGKEEHPLAQQRQVQLCPEAGHELSEDVVERDRRVERGEERLGGRGEGNPATLNRILKEERGIAGDDLSRWGERRGKERERGR